MLHISPNVTYLVLELILAMAHGSHIFFTFYSSTLLTGHNIKEVSSGILLVSLSSVDSVQ
jgi:hypothetical protein